MNIKELKKLVDKMGGVLVMDGDEPSFVMLSYDDYNNLSGKEVAGQDQNEAVQVVVRNESKDYIEEFGHNLHAELVPTQEGRGSSMFIGTSNLVENFGEQGEQLEEQDGEKIKQLNEEIVLLKNGIKQKELEALDGENG